MRVSVIGTMLAAPVVVLCIFCQIIESQLCNWRRALLLKLSTLQFKLFRILEAPTRLI